MKTNEEIKRALLLQAEETIEGLLWQVQQIEEGNFQELEHQVLSAVVELGRKCLGELIEQSSEKRSEPARRVGACGHRQRLVSTRPRQLLTLLGPITFHRGYYHCLSSREQAKTEEESRCHHGEIPFDQHWGIDQHRSSPGLQRAVSYLSASLTQEEVAEAVARLLPWQISARQVGHVARAVGEAFEQWENRRVHEAMQEGSQKQTSETEQQEKRKEPIKRLYVEMDGVMARLRRGSVPMEKDEQERDGDIYREVKVGAVFVGVPGHKRSELVPGVFVDTPGPIRYLARRTTVDDFAPRLYELAQRSGVVRAQQVVVLADGARWIWRVAAEQFPGAVQIVDEYHAREHVWEVARAAFVEEPGLRDTWAQMVIEKLTAGQIEDVIAALERLPPLEATPGKSRSLLEVEAEYFRRNAERMRYPVFRAQGIHVGSGIAEAACKTVVSTRAKRSGMRWTPQGLDAILALRTAVLNDGFDQLWQETRRVA